MTEVKRRLRCAVYTRKSTEEGLDMEFNSLDAQREAGEAYVLSQRHEGWTMVSDYYDDGGFSGGSMERPALKRLMKDIEAGLIDVVVVYKVDRLSRSLMDFAKLVETFDKHNVSFVSVTQQFNTTTSMGRLTLNILLSFAQFEREVIGERIRDKFAASKRKGMWMGGPPPLGYDVVGRKLIVNETEAKQVRYIFERFKTLLGDGCDARVERNSVLPEKVPGDGLIIIYDGDPGDPDLVLGGFGSAYYQHAIEVVVYVEEGNPTQRDQKFDALLLQIGAVLEAHADLDGLVAGLTYSRPEISIEPVIGGPAIKTGTIILLADYEAETPLS